MTVILKTIEDNIVTTLEDNIPDPISRAIGSFIDHGKGHYKAKTPKILVTRGGEITSPFTGAGEIKQDYVVRFQIRLDVQASVTGTVGGTQYSGNALANVLSDKIAEVMEDNVLDISGIKQVQRESIGDYTYDDMHYYIHIYNVYVVNN